MYCTDLFYDLSPGSLGACVWDRMGARCACCVAPRLSGQRRRDVLWVWGIMDILPRQHECDVSTGSGACVIVNSGTRRLSFARQLPNCRCRAGPFHFGR